MIKRALIVSLLIICMPACCHCLVIKNLQIFDYGTSARFVITTDTPPTYNTFKGNDFFRIKINNAQYSSTSSEVLCSFFKRLALKKEYDGLSIIANYKYLTSTKVSYNKDLNKLVVTFNRISRFPLPRIVTPEVLSVIKKVLDDTIKISVDLSGPTEYNIRESGSNIIVELPRTNSIIKSRKIETADTVVKKIAIDQAGSSVILSINMAYPAYYKAYSTEAPYRVVLEIDKGSKSTMLKKDVAPGVTYMKIVKGSKTGAAYANLLLIDPASVEVRPFLPTKKADDGSFIDSLISAISPPPPESGIYYKEKVSDMVRSSGAIAGINGTYFGHNGEPLGILMINKELISYSIYDRTSLLIDNNNRCYIDNVSLSGEISIEGKLLEVTGINEKRETGDVVIYTPRYGKQTGDETPGLNLSVEDGIIKYMSRGRTWIPKRGYVISIDPTYYEKLRHSVDVGNKVGLNIRISTFQEFKMEEIKHIIGGGPRLVKGGQIYISKNIERFKSDIATSRASRTAVGITNSGKLMLVTVDKNKTVYYPETSPASSGMTLEELAALMQELGAVEAMNLDGGGSTTFVMGGKVLNNPSNGEEIRVSNALLIIPRTSSEKAAPKP